MADIFDDPQKLQEFKQYMSSQGFTEDDANSFVSEYRSQEPAPVGDVAQVDLIQPAPLESKPIEIPEQIQQVEEAPVEEARMELMPENKVVEQPRLQRVQMAQEQPTEQPMPTSQLNGQVTQPFGNPNAKLYGRDKRGRANINRGVDISAEAGEPQAAPKSGEWVVESAYAGDGFNTGWGRSVVIKNTQTGETIRRSHLDKVMVKPGQKVTGQVIGTTGRSGRTTGYHKDIEYTDPKGRLSDFTKSPYAKE